MIIDFACQRYRVPPSWLLLEDIDCMHSHLAVNVEFALTAQKEQNRIIEEHAEKKKLEDQMSAINNLSGKEVSL